MRALCDLVGLPVVNLLSGEVVGEIDHVHWRAPTGEIAGITVRGNYASGSQYFLFNEVDRVGQDAVFVRNATEPRRQPSGAPRSLNGLPVYDQYGTELGSVDDLILDVVNGKVLGLNVTGGLLRDLVQGRQFIPWQAAQLGKDAIIVDDSLDRGEDGNS